MRFFTKEWASGELSDEQFELVPRAYDQHLLHLKLPLDVQSLASSNLHDGLVREVAPSKNELQMCLTTGDLESGYHLTTVVYTGREAPLAGPALKDAQNAKDANEVVNDELDRTEDGFVHRLRFANGSEVHIHFSDVRVSYAPLATRDTPLA